MYRNVQGKLPPLFAEIVNDGVAMIRTFMMKASKRLGLLDHLFIQWGGFVAVTTSCSIRGGSRCAKMTSGDSVLWFS